MPQTTTVPGTVTKPKLERPRRYKVILLNDDYTPREFVVLVLRAVFRLNDDQAQVVMVTAHQKGACVVAVFPSPRRRRARQRISPRPKAIRFSSPPSLRTDPQARGARLAGMVLACDAADRSLEAASPLRFSFDGRRNPVQCLCSWPSPETSCPVAPWSIIVSPSPAIPLATHGATLTTTWRPPLRQRARHRDVRHRKMSGSAAPCRLRQWRSSGPSS